MFYMTADEGKSKVIVLETENLEHLKKGNLVLTPDGSVLIAWTPDPEWLAQRILGCGGDMEKVGAAIAEAAERPQAPLRPSHGMKKVEFK